MEPRRPLPWIALTVAAGVLAGLELASGRPVGVAALSSVLVGTLVVRRARRAAAALGVLAALACLHGWAAAPAGGSAHGHLDLEGGRDVPIHGRWRPLGARRGWVEPAPGQAVGPGHGLLFVLDALAPASGERVTILPGGMLGRWPEGPERGPRRRGRFVAASSVAADELVRHGAPRSAPQALGQRLRRALLDRTAALEPRGAGRGLVSALVVGDRSGLAPEILDLFTRTGTRHLLALSGLHVGLLVFTLLLPASALLGRLPRPRAPAARRRLVLGLRLAALGVYALAVGPSAPVARASLAVACFLIAPVLPTARGSEERRGRVVDPLSVWSFALLCECLTSPRALTSPSLTLSYAATLGILVGTRPLLRLLRPRSDALEELHARGPWIRALRGVTQRCAAFARGGLAASASAVLATLPLVWGLFGELSPVGVVATGLALAPLALLLATSWVGVLVPALPVELAGEPLCALLLGILRLADALPGTPWVVPARPAVLVLGLVVGTFATLRSALEGAPRRPVLGRAVALGWGVLLLPWSAAPLGLEVHALDVGHGASYVLRAPGLPALVFDAGSRDRPEVLREALAPLLARWEVRRPWIALSHTDADHSQSIPRLADRFPPAVWLGPAPARIGARVGRRTRIVDVERGRCELALEPSGPLELAWVRGLPGPGNEGSRTLVVTWRGARVVLCGDAEGPGLRRALEEALLGGPVRLLAFPHHGSHSPWTGAMLERLMPQEVWISAGATPPVGEELTRRRIPWRWTGRGPLALDLP